MHTISLDNLNYYCNYFNKLRKAKLEFDIITTEKYIPKDNGKSYYDVSHHPSFKNVSSIRNLADIWMASPNNIKIDSIQTFLGFEAIYNDPCSTKINGDLYRKNVSSVKFYAASVFDNNPRVNLSFIHAPVPETTLDGHVIRHCVQGNRYNNGCVIFCGDETHPLYNYIDKGHIIVYVSTGDPMEDGNRVFVTDSITLDMNYIIAAATIYPPAIDEILQHKAFIPSKDSRLQLLKMERVIPAKVRDEYVRLKGLIQEDFSKNTSNVMIGKLTRKESPFIDLNGIRITGTRADYTAGNVSIEAPNLAEIIFAKLNPNEADWDIFTLINIYTDYVNDLFKGLPLNAEETGFLAAKSFSFSINDIPLTVSCFTENTRRAINGHLINVDELSSVLKRAACYQTPLEATDESNIKNFDNFITNVSRYSLKLRDVWANGLPVKTVYFESDRSSYGKSATPKHPKLRFKLKDKKGFFLEVNVMDPADKNKVLSTNEYRIGKFAEFVKKVDAANKRAYMNHIGYFDLTTEGFYVPRAGMTANTVAPALGTLLTAYAEGITEDDKKNIVGVINYELGAAEKRSEELLKEACQLTGSTKSTRDGKTGYVVPGKMRTYFVEEEGSNKVYDNDPKSANPYFCVVNRGDMGAGRDALISRIFALHNDKMMAKQIHTLNRA